jgi:hypothetical protein
MPKVSFWSLEDIKKWDAENIDIGDEPLAGWYWQYGEEFDAPIGPFTTREAAERDMKKNTAEEE